MTEHEPIEDSPALTDGRILSCAKWWPADAQPVFDFHGFSGSNHELDLTRAALKRSGLPLRVITLDRPGFGASTFQSRRSLPADVAEAALRLRRHASD
jgi:pimeloyl-ACP methyl ester carboxylesterase